MESLLVEKLGQFIRKECQKRQITTKQFVELCQNRISVDYVNKIKQKVPQSVSIETLQIIADGVGISLKQLMIEIGLIDSIQHEVLSKDEAHRILKGLKPFLDEFLEVENMTAAQRYELACQIYETLKILSYKYK